MVGEVKLWAVAEKDGLLALVEKDRLLELVEDVGCWPVAEEMLGRDGGGSALLAEENGFGALVEEAGL